jgi:opacity protein-like surface antigen
MKMLARHLGAAIFSLCFVIVATSSATFAADLGAKEGTAGYEQNFSQPLSDRYIRIDAGLGWFDDASFYQADVHDNGGSFVEQEIGKQGSISIGLGRQLRSWLRVDLTGEYRVQADIKGYDNLTGTLTTGEYLQANTRYNGELSAFVGMANIYADLGRFGRITPYVGAGAGFSRVEVSNLNTYTVGSLSDPATGAYLRETSEAYSANNSEWNFAWALMAGFAMDWREGTKLDVGYRYIDLGSGTAGASDLLICVCGTIGQQLELSDLTAHEMRVGLRIPLGHREEPAQPLK